MVTARETYTVGADVLYRELEGEMVLMDSGSAEYFSLNRTGTRVWELLRAGTTVGDICLALARSYDVPEERAMGDLVPFLEELTEAGLVRPGAVDAPG